MNPIASAMNIVLTALLSTMNTKAFRGGVGSRNYFWPSILCHVSNSLNSFSNCVGVIILVYVSADCVQVSDIQ